jgi:hypothetical protein
LDVVRRVGLLPAVLLRSRLALVGPALVGLVLLRQLIGLPRVRLMLVEQVLVELVLDGDPARFPLSSVMVSRW